MSNMCLSPEDAHIKELTGKIAKKYPNECARIGFNAARCASWVGKYNEVNNKNIAYIPDMDDLLSYVEKWANMSGKSFFYIPEQVKYTPKGKKEQTYTVIGDKIFNKDNEEVYPADASNAGIDRVKIAANLRVQKGEAVIVNYKDTNYVVNKKDQIVSTKSGKIMQWKDNDGNRKAILEKAHNAFQAKNNPATPATVSPEERTAITNQLVGHFVAMSDATGAKVFTSQSDVDRYFKEHPNTAVQEAMKEQAEMQEIREKALADGTFMKAPNGKDTNLTEKQWLQVRTKAFKDWFGDWENDPQNASKVVDENGEPLVVWHGGSNVNIFDTSGKRSGGAGIKKGIKGSYFTTSKNDAERYEEIYAFKTGEQWIAYADQLREEGATEEDIAEIDKLWETQKPATRAFFLNIKTPIETIYTGNDKDGYTENTTTPENYDGQHITIEGKSYEEYVATNPNQIKSATDNVGTFSRENDNIQMFIGKKARTQFEQQLRKARPDLAEEKHYVLNGNVFYEYEGKLYEYGEMSQDAYDKYEKEGILEKQGNNHLLTEKGKQVAKLETGIDEVLNFLHSLEDNKENTAYIKTAIRWIANRSITLPQDDTKARQAFDLARKKNIDIQKYATLGELVAAPEMQPKEKEREAFDPDKAKTFSNKSTVTTKGGRVFTVYDVENTSEGQREVCKALAAHYEMSPWCLSTFTSKGEPTESAEYYWDVYSALPRKIAFENGKPVAFSSDRSETPDDIPSVIGTLDGLEVNRINKKLAYVVYEGDKKQMDRLVKEGLIYLEVTNDYWLTEKGINQADFGPDDPYKKLKDKKTEAWWDMEDRYPQDSLSDNIVATPTKKTDEVEAFDDYWGDIDRAMMQHRLDEVDAYAAEAPADRQNRQNREQEVIHNYLEPVTEHIAENIKSTVDIQAVFTGTMYENSSEEVKNTIINNTARRYAIEELRRYANLPEFIEFRNNPDAHQMPLIEYDIPTYSIRLRIGEEMERYYTNSLPVDDIYDNNDLSYFKTSEGEVYGFVGADGNVYLDMSKISPEHPIHEYTHLWDRALKARNPKLWQRGVQLMKSKSLVIPGHTKTMWQEIEDSDNYGKKWKKMGITGERLENLIASEVHARVVGENGEKLLNDIAANQGSDSIIDKLKKWILDAWKELKATFSDWTQDEIDKLTLADFNHMVVRDFANKVTLQQSQNTQQQVQNELSKESSTARFGVVIDPNLKDNYKTWQQQHPEGIVAYRVNFNSYNTPAEVEAGHIGNPFSEGDNRGPSTVEQFYNWIVTGNNYGNPKATEEFRQAIIDKILATPNNVPILYYKELGRPSHATAIGYLVNNKQILQNARQQNQAQQQGVLDVTKAEFYSGGAKGADTVWRRRAEALGIKVVEYTPEDFDKLSKEQREKYGLEYLSVVKDLARTELPINSKGGKLVRRDMMQADSADAIFAVSTVVKPGEKGKKGFENKAGKEVVDGGTGYAVQRGIQRGIPVYVFDQNDGQWKMWDANSNSFVVIAEPTLTPNAATVGTREINNDGVNAIDSILRKSTGMNGVTPSSTPTPAPTSFANTSEAAKPQEIKRPHSQAYESALNVKDSRIARFNRTFTPQQIKDRGAMISDMFTDIVDEELNAAIEEQNSIANDETLTKEEREQAKIKLNKLRDPLEGRQFIVREITVPVIVDRIIEGLNYNMQDAEGNERVLYKNTIEYFEELFNTQASLDIEEREGVRIIDLKLQEQTDRDNDNDEKNDGNDEVGHYASGSDGWSFQIRFENPFNSLSKKVKGMMYEVYRPEEEKDDLGHIRKYPMGQIYASFLSYLSKNMRNPDDFLQVIDKDNYDSIQNFRGTLGEFNEDNMEKYYPNGYPTFPVLEKMAMVYPWVSQVIDRLTNDYLNPEEYVCFRFPPTGGSMASQFYSNFRKAYIPYAKIQLGANKFGVTPLNYEMEEKAQLDKLVANFNNRMIMSPLSIYNSDGKINRKNAASLEKMASSLSDSIAKNEYHTYPEEIAEARRDGDNEHADRMEEAFDKFIADVQNVLRAFGADATRDGVVSYLMMEEGSVLQSMLSDLSTIGRIVSKVEDKNVDTFNYLLDVRNNFNKNLVEHLFDGRGLISDMSYVQSYYDSASKKTKYSYSADNFLMKRFRGIAMGTLEERRKYIDDNFGRFEWFRDQTQPRGNGWRNAWLEFWYNYDKDIDIIPYRNIDNVSTYNTDELTGESTGTDVRPYTKWTKSDIWEVQDRSYDKDNAGKGKDAGFYLAPIFSDSPMSMTVRGPKMNFKGLVTGYVDENGVRHRGAFIELIQQELWRIGYVKRRAKAINDSEGKLKPIANFDEGVGELFCFMPELNDYKFEDGKTFLEKMVEMKADGTTVSSEIENLQVQAVIDILEEKFNDYVRKNGDKYDKNTNWDQVREQYYNMTYANSAIIQITTVDLAYYGKGRQKTVNGTLNKAMLDFQKRFKEVYAGGIELNTNSKYGTKTENVAIIADDIVTSPSYKEIAAVIDKSENLSKNDKKRIKKILRKVNIADAQAIRAMTSFRSILDMLGRWDDNMEKALSHFRDNSWNREDFDIIYQTLKPFMYTVIDRNDGFGDTIAVPQQHKNSEICALMMYDLISQGLSKSPFYTAFSRFMERHKDANGNPLISMIQFESAGKAGNQGVVNVSWSPRNIVKAINREFDPENQKDNEIKDLLAKHDLYVASITDEDGNVIGYYDNTEENAHNNFYGTDGIKAQLDRMLEEDKLTQKEYNRIIAYLRPTAEEIEDMLDKGFLITGPEGEKSINPETVHTVPFENFYQQQPTPEHHIDTEATFGSQTRNINVADLPKNFKLTLEGKYGAKTTLKSGDEVIDFYYELLDENLIEDFFGKGMKKGLKGLFESKASFRDAVKDIVRGNPKYSRDFADALELDDKGDFVLSPNSPTMFQIMQEIVTSLFRNRITKQKINGAALIQAAGIGLDDELRVRFDDNGKLLGVECYMPLTARRFFEPLLKSEVINGETVQVLDPEVLKKAGLDKAIGYRIPTENKSSIMPLIIKGFTPLQNGSSIIVASEITALSGSDFDVDKMFLMLSSFYIREYNMEMAKEAFLKTLDAEAGKEWQETVDKNENEAYLDLIVDRRSTEFNKWFDENKDDFLLKEPEIRKIEYDFTESPKDNGRRARNNMIIQIMYKILISKDGAESLFNPQGFEDVERAAKINKILTDEELLSKLIERTNGIASGIMPPVESVRTVFMNMVKERDPDNVKNWEMSIKRMSDDEVMFAYMRAIVDPRMSIDMLLTADTRDLQDFIDENSSPESPIYPQTFMEAHARNMAGSIQIGIYAVQASMAAKYQRASITLKQQHRFQINGKDMYKLDVSEGGKRLKNNGQMVGASADNGKNPNLTDMGSTSDTAPLIGYLLRLGMNHLEATLIINQSAMRGSNYDYRKMGSKKDYMEVEVGNITTDMLIRGAISPLLLTPEESLRIDALCYKLLLQNEAIEYVTNVSRADSPNGAMENTYAKARVQRYNVDLLQGKMAQDGFPFNKINETLSNDAIDVRASEDSVREQLKAQPMALLHAMYALGINSFDSLMAPYFFGAQKWFDESITKTILYNLNPGLSKEKKEEAVDRIYKSYITYRLSSSPLFGKEDEATMKQKRAFYLYAFPEEYKKILQENETIRDLLKNILQVVDYGNREKIVLQDMGSLDKSQRADIQRRLETLLDSDDQARKLATDLLIYSYFDNGLQFTPNSFSTMFDVRFLTSFDAYTGTLTNLNDEPDGNDLMNFIVQFMITYPSYAYNADRILKKDGENPLGWKWLDGENAIEIDFNNKDTGEWYKKQLTNEVLSPNPEEYRCIYPFIQYNGELYMIDQDALEANPNAPVYRKLPTYATSYVMPLFNSKMSAEEMAVEFPQIVETPTKTPTDIHGNPMEDDIPMPVDDPTLDGNNMYDSPDTYAGGGLEIDLNDLPEFSMPLNNVGSTNTKRDVYTQEGENKLQDKWC